MFSGSAFASAPLSTTAEIFTIPFLVRSSATCPRIMSLSSSHSDPRTVPRLSQHPRRLLAIQRFAGHHGPSRDHQTRLAAKVSRLWCLVVFFGPAFVFIGVFSFGCVLLQVVNPSFTRPQPGGVSNPSAHLAFEAFPLAFGLSSTLAFCLCPSPWDFSMARPASLGCCYGWRVPAAFCLCGVSCHCPPMKESWPIDPFCLFLCSCPLKQS